MRDRALPSGLVPPIMFGAIASVRTASLAWTFMVYDSKDPRNRWGLFLKAAVSDGNPNVQNPLWALRAKVTL